MNGLRNRLGLGYLFAAVSLGLLSPVARSQAIVTDGMLTDYSGIPLYTFDRDTAGKSACDGFCAKVWLPFTASSSSAESASAGSSRSGDYSSIQRADGTKQWAYKGRPLYYMFSQKGHGVDDGWHIAKP